MWARDFVLMLLFLTAAGCGLSAEAGPTTSEAQASAPADWKLESVAPWQPRDSQVELVFANRLWVMGGWFRSDEAPPRDVWSSADGKSWTRVLEQAPWLHSDLAMGLVFKERMWFFGGWYNGRLPGHSASNEVWSSVDGTRWQRVQEHAPWSARLAAGAVVHQDRMWIIGGTTNYYFGDANSVRRDVWSSADGVSWKQETQAAPWKARAYHQAVAHNGRIYVMGGGDYTPQFEAHNDVWSSADGVHWTQETEQAPWPPRIWFSAASYRGCLWVLGGWSKDKGNHGDVWFSADGKTWSQLRTQTCWKSRHEHSAWVFQDKLWVGGGHAKPLSSEVWSLQLPPDWRP